MVSFFRLNSPDRLFYLLALLLGWGIYTLTISRVPTYAELNWMLVGERMANGFWLYQDIWTETAPIPALLYAIIVGLFGKSLFAFQVAGLTISLIIVIQFQRSGFNNDIYLERSWIPALVLGVLFYLSPELLSPSPAMMATLVILSSFNRVFRHIKKPLKNDELLLMGLIQGVAGLCYQPALVFVFLLFGALVFYSATSPRQYLLIAIGVVVPFVVLLLVYTFRGGVADLWYNYFLGSISLRTKVYMGWSSMIVYWAITLVVLLLSMVGVSTNNRSTYYQTLIQIIMFLWFLVGAAAMFLSPYRSPFVQVPLLLPVAFFIAQFLLTFSKKRFLADMGFTIWLGTIVVLYILQARNHASIAGLINQSKQLAAPSETLPYHDLQGLNKSILVFGKSKHLYIGNSLAGPYLEPELGAREMEDLDNYETMLKIYQRFDKQWPAIIVDFDGSMHRLMQRMPAISRLYKQSGRQGVYFYQGKK